MIQFTVRVDGPHVPENMAPAPGETLVEQKPGPRGGRKKVCQLCVKLEGPGEGGEVVVVIEGRGGISVFIVKGLSSMGSGS